MKMLHFDEWLRQAFVEEYKLVTDDPSKLFQVRMTEEQRRRFRLTFWALAGKEPNA